MHALGRGDMKVGNGTGVNAEIRRGRPANFAAVGLMTTSRQNGTTPGLVRICPVFASGTTQRIIYANSAATSTTVLDAEPSS
jgi:hypothetical protein